MHNLLCSLIIPAYNNWPLTCSCLESIAANTDITQLEVIVIDNASSDETAKECPILGTTLFGGHFHYVHNEINNNFAGASNQGAKLASGEFLVFLNNDTQVQSGWLPPLLDDFSNFPKLAATGPILVYAKDGFFGHFVQHLGIVTNPWLNLLHLYKGIPLSSPLAKKRRFFQAITAACLVMPRTIYYDNLGFDENFINGYEDVDFCARLGKKGFRFTVNPESVVLHHESISPGRYTHEKDNSRLLGDGNLKLLVPDWHIKIMEDDLVPVCSKFGNLFATLPEPLIRELDHKFRNMNASNLGHTIKRYPLWENGWQNLFRYSKENRFEIINQQTLLFPFPDQYLDACNFAISTYNHELLLKFLALLAHGNYEPYYIFKNIRKRIKYCDEHGFENVGLAFKNWVRLFNKYTNEIYPNFIGQFERIIGLLPKEVLLLNDDLRAMLKNKKL